MFNFLKKITSNKTTKKGNKSIAIYELLSTHYKDGQLLPEAFNLPDEKKDGVPFAPGAQDGTMLYHTAMQPDPAVTSRIYTLIEQGCNCKLENEMDEDSVQKIFKEMSSHSAWLYAVPVLQKVIEHKPDGTKIINYCTRIIANSPKREPIKFCLVLIAAFAMEDLYDTFALFAKHDEFTKYALFPIRGIKENKSPVEMKRLCEHVSGWGKIHLVNSIINYEKVLSKEMKTWLLLEGFKTDVMDQYLALSCAEVGELAAFLKKKAIKKEEALSLARLITALIEEGPVAGISQLENAETILNDYIKLSEKFQEDTTIVAAAEKAKEYLSKK